MGASTIIPVHQRREENVVHDGKRVCVQANQHATCKFSTTCATKAAECGGLSWWSLSFGHRGQRRNRGNCGPLIKQHAHLHALLVTFIMDPSGAIDHVLRRSPCVGVIVQQPPAGCGLVLGHGDIVPSIGRIAYVDDNAAQIIAVATERNLLVGVYVVQVRFSMYLKAIHLEAEEKRRVFDVTPLKWGARLTTTLAPADPLSICFHGDSGEVVVDGGLHTREYGGSNANRISRAP